MALALSARVMLLKRRKFVPVRISNGDEAVPARATQSRALQSSEVSVVHVEGTGRTIHVAPPSWVTSSSTRLRALVAATRQFMSSLHERAVTASPVVHASARGVDHVDPSLVKERRDAPVMPVPSTMAHAALAKQSSALTPRPPLGAVATDTDWSLGL
jgi:hypothetical protein